MLQASPSPLSSVSACSGLLSNGQLSQTSPTPSLSESNCRGLYTSGQLSWAKHIISYIHAQAHTHKGCEYLMFFSLYILQVTPRQTTVSLSHLWRRRCRRQGHRRPLVRPCPGPPVPSLVAWGSCPAVTTQLSEISSNEKTSSQSRWLGYYSTFWQW